LLVRWTKPCSLAQACNKEGPRCSCLRCPEIALTDRLEQQGGCLSFFVRATFAGRPVLSARLTWFASTSELSKIAERLSLLLLLLLLLLFVCLCLSSSSFLIFCGSPFFSPLFSSFLPSLSFLFFSFLFFSFFIPFYLASQSKSKRRKKERKKERKKRRKALCSFLSFLPFSFVCCFFLSPGTTNRTWRQV